MDRNKAVNILHLLEEWAKRNQDDEFLDEFRLLDLANEGNQSENPEVADRMMDFAIQQHERKQKFLEANALSTLAGYWGNKRKFGLSFENHLAAYNIYKNLNPSEFPAKGDCLYGLAGLYYHYDDNENAIKFMSEALQAIVKREDMEKPIYNSIGLSYRKMGQYDSSESYFRRIYNKAVARNDSVWIGIAAGNIGINYFLQKRYEEAIPLLEKDIELSIASKSLKNATHSLGILAEIYFYRKDYSTAEQLLNRALSLANGRSFWQDYQLAEPIFTLLSKIYAIKGDINRAYLYSDSALVAKDSVTSQNNAVTFLKAKERTDLAQRTLEQEQLANQRKMQQLIRDGLIVAIILLTVIAILFINRQRLNQKKLEAEKRNTESDLELATAQLDSFRQSMQEKNRLIEHFTSELSQLKENEQPETETDVLTQLQHAIILTDEQWEQFRIMFEKVHKNFFVNLKNKMPDLTQAEVRFLALTKLRLTSKEMAGMLGISQNAIRMYRHRLRRKLELDKEDMIEELVDNI